MSFKVGDSVKIVRIIENDYGKPTLPDKYLGMYGTIVRILDDRYTDTPYVTVLDCDNHPTEYFNSVEIEKVEVLPCQVSELS